jgi:hypothetical protein
MISVIWTKSDLIGSRLICWCTNTPSSHFAIVLDSRLVFQSTLSKGVHLSWLHNFLYINTIVHRIDLKATPVQEEAIYQRMIDLEDRPYDYPALIYMGYRYLLYKVMRTPLPVKNRLGSPRADICIELAKVLEVIGVRMPSLDTATPESLYYYIKDKLA